VDPQLNAIVDTMLGLDASDPRFQIQYGYLKGQLDMIRGIAFFEEDVYTLAAAPEAEEETRKRMSDILKEKMRKIYLTVTGRR
jgi:hypothetical protein